MPITISNQRYVNALTNSGLRVTAVRHSTPRHRNTFIPKLIFALLSMRPPSFLCLPVYRFRDKYGLGAGGSVERVAFYAASTGKARAQAGRQTVGRNGVGQGRHVVPWEAREIKLMESSRSHWRPLDWQSNERLMSWCSATPTLSSTYKVT
jgi:hypothetical protein